MLFSTISKASNVFFIRQLELYRNPDKSIGTQIRTQTVNVWFNHDMACIWTKLMVLRRPIILIVAAHWQGRICEWEIIVAHMKIQNRVNRKLIQGARGKKKYLLSGNMLNQKFLCSWFFIHQCRKSSSFPSSYVYYYINCSSARALCSLKR